MYLVTLHSGIFSFTRKRVRVTSAHILDRKREKSLMRLWSRVREQQLYNGPGPVYSDAVHTCG
jgi:hypothetical protein